MSPPNNPHKKRPPLAPHNCQMGRQSQQRVSNTKRAFLLASTNSFPRKKAKGGDQLTLLGKVVFDSQRDCKVCIAQSIQKTFSPHSVPERAHHELCVRNTVTRGIGPVTSQLLERQAEEKRPSALCNTQLKPSEKASGKCLTKEATKSFFLPRTATMTTPTNKVNTVVSPTIAKPMNLSKAASTMTGDADFEKKHKNKGAPLAMTALATNIMGRLNDKEGNTFFTNNFDGLTFTVPPCEGNNNPQCHSMIGQKLLLVDWIKQGASVPCPSDQCCGFLQNKRSNFSKNQTLFPVFGFRAPRWCMVKRMDCNKCRRGFDPNEGRVLLMLPACMAAKCPAETKFALPNKNCHLHRTATEVFDSVMLTCGNGELCSRILCDSIDRDLFRG